MFVVTPVFSQDIEVLAVDRYTLRRPDPKALLLGFAGYDEAAIREGVIRLSGPSGGLRSEEGAMP
jgi:hypothetical protein